MYKVGDSVCYRGGEFNRKLGKIGQFCTIKKVDSNAYDNVPYFVIFDDGHETWQKAESLGFRVGDTVRIIDPGAGRYYHALAKIVKDDGSMQPYLCDIQDYHDDAQWWARPKDLQLVAVSTAYEEAAKENEEQEARHGDFRGTGSVMVVDDADNEIHTQAETSTTKPVRNTLSVLCRTESAAEECARETELLIGVAPTMAGRERSFDFEYWEDEHQFKKNLKKVLARRIKH